MKRSEINTIMDQAVTFLDEMKFSLPPFAFWEPEAWKSKGSECREIVESQLGWDITDFGAGRFDELGLFLFTIRNGTLTEMKKPLGKVYAEKVLIVQPQQITPAHFHHQKMEDIINRGGGELVVQLWNSTEDNKLAETPIHVQVDGATREIEAAGFLRLRPGESVTLPQRLYHKFWAEGGTVLVGEVSRVNDDHVDNFFYDDLGRFPEIEEDEPPRHLLINDYATYYFHASASAGGGC